MALLDSDRLTRREREILHVLFALGNRASAEEIRARLSDAPSSSSVRVMLARMEAKRYLRHVEEGPKYVYSATVSATVAKKTALLHTLRTFFDGSLSEMVTGLVTQGSWTEDEIAELRATVERLRPRKKR